MFRIIFVMDILHGNTVHAIRGERAKYQPIKDSRICDSSHPIEIISALDPKEVYIADLDRLQHLGDNFGLIKEISEKTKTMVDIGAKDMNDIEKCAQISDNVIMGTETASLDLIENAAGRFPGRINVSIDMRNGRVITNDSGMQVDPGELVRRLNDHDIRDIIVLELTRVGTGAGIDIPLLKELADTSKHDILVGGGIKDMGDIDALKKIGIRGALVATAVHNGKIPVEFIRRTASVFTE